MTRKLYTGRQVDVSFDREICQHAAVCVREMPEVFNLQARPWINPDGAWTPEAAGLLIDVVSRCPSGALKIERPEQPERVDSGEITVVRNPDASRYEAFFEGKQAGFAEYVLSEGLITFSHTETDPAYEGRGIGSALARGALDDVRVSSQRRVLPLCPFIKGWMQRHPEYADLVRR